MKVEPGHQKRRVLEELLAEGMVLIALDARAEGVAVPEHLAHDPQLRLNLSYRFGLPMDVGIEGVAATLTFGGVPHACMFPWRAIFLMVCHGGGQPHLFPDDIPVELGYEPQGELDGVLEPSVRPMPEPDAPSATRPRLSLVRSTLPETEAEEATPASKNAASPRPAAARLKGSTSGPRTLRASPLIASAPVAPEKGQRGEDASPPKPSVSAPEPSQQKPPTPKSNEGTGTPNEPSPSSSKSRSHLRVVK